MLRVSFHPDVGRVVLSIWDHEVCMATFRLGPEDVPELVRGLTASLITSEGVPVSGSATVAIPIPVPPPAASA